VTKQSHSYDRRRRVAISSSGALRLLGYVRNDIALTSLQAPRLVLRQPLYSLWNF